MPRRAARLQQHEHGARAAVVRARLTERDHFRLLHEPRAHLALQDRLLSDGAEPLAVNHAQTAQPALHRFADELGQRLARFLAAHAVQIELRLYDPRAAPELPDNFLADARAVVGQRFVDVEQTFGIVFVGERFLQDGFLVAAALQRHGRRHARDGRAGRRPERLDFADRAAELVGIGDGFAFGARRRNAPHLALLGIGLQCAFQRRQAREALALHGRGDVHRLWPGGRGASFLRSFGSLGWGRFFGIVWPAVIVKERERTRCAPVVPRARHDGWGRAQCARTRAETDAR